MTVSLSSLRESRDVRKFSQRVWYWEQCPNGLNLQEVVSKHDGTFQRVQKFEDDGSRGEQPSNLACLRPRIDKIVSRNANVRSS
jgi:hypothetical protein